MAERRRGLGRGLGALIPDVVTEERPIDVFFPSQEGSGDVSRETSEERSSKDPAVSMRRARTDKKAKPGTKRSSSTTKAGAARDSGSAAGDVATGKTVRTVEKSSPTEQMVSASRTTTTPARNVADRSAASESASRGDDVSRETSLESVPGTAFGLLPVDSISANPRQPRAIFDEDALDELVHSIREVGVLQPVVVRLVDAEAPRYELIMGERRLRASREAGLETIPAIIRQVDDVDLLRDALLENLHRADLNPLEEAAAYQQLLDDFQCTQEELSTRIGRSRPQITNTLRLLKLPPLVQRRVAAGVISQGHARAILGLVDAAAMEVLAQRVVAEGLSVRATEEAVVLLNRGDRVNVSRETPALDPELSSLARSLGDQLDTRVRITMGKRKGRISVDFANEDDLTRILGVLGLSPSSDGNASDTP